MILYITQEQDINRANLFGELRAFIENCFSYLFSELIKNLLLPTKVLVVYGDTPSITEGGQEEFYHAAGTPTPMGLEVGTCLRDLLGQVGLNTA
jgi:hypothetical protein